MKKIIAITLSTVCAVALQAQQSDRHIPQPGDEIVIRQVEYKDPGRNGENVIWNFSRLKSVNDEYTVTYSAPALIGASQCYRQEARTDANYYGVVRGRYAQLKELIKESDGKLS
jgi:hypothetical protein